VTKSDGNSAWRIPEGLLEKFDQRAQGRSPAGETGQTSYSAAVEEADRAPAGFSAEQRERICLLAAYTVPEPSFARGPER
jgi:hypothetical protein